MYFLAEIADQSRWLVARNDWIVNLPADLEPAANLLIIGGVYLVLLLLGLGIDIIIGVRLLMARLPGELRGRALLTQPGDWNRHVERLKGRTWTWREAGLMAVILLAAQLVAQGVPWVFVTWGVGSMDSDMAAALCQGAGFHGVGLAALAWLIYRRRVSWADAFGMRWREVIHRVGQGMVCYLGILPIVFVTSLACQLILFWLGYPLSMQNVVLFFLEPQSPGIQVALLVLALGVAPLTEEALFRGVALPLLARTAGVIPAIVVTAACFALIHFHLPSFAPLFVLAAGLAVAYIVTESLWVPVVMHALFNGMNIGLLLLAAGR